MELGDSWGLFWQNKTRSKLVPHSKWIIYLLAILSNSDIDEIMKVIKSVAERTSSHWSVPRKQWVLRRQR